LELIWKHKREGNAHSINEYIRKSKSILFDRNFKLENRLNNNNHNYSQIERIEDITEKQSNETKVVHIRNEEIEKQYEILQQKLSDFEREWNSFIKSRIVFYYTISVHALLSLSHPLLSLLSHRILSFLIDFWVFLV
jgi:hypothetical protein